MRAIPWPWQLCTTGALSLGIVLAAGFAPSSVAPYLDPSARPQARAAQGSDDHQCLSLTLLWEAGTEGRAGMLGVGWVVLNRVNDPRFPSSVCGVVRDGGEDPGCQFSYWCDGKGDTPDPGAVWRLAQRVAETMLSAPPGDPTGGALFYHTDNLESIPWTVSRQRTVQIGSHIYYR